MTSPAAHTPEQAALLALQEEVERLTGRLARLERVVRRLTVTCEAKCEAGCNAATEPAKGKGRSRGNDSGPYARTQERVTA